MTQAAVWGWKNLGGAGIEYDGAANCTSGYSKYNEDGEKYMGEAERVTSGGVTMPVFFTDTFNRIFRFNVSDTLASTQKGKIVIYKNDVKIIDYETALVPDAIAEPYGDLMFAIGQAEGDGSYITGTALTSIGDYGQTNAIKFMVCGANASDVKSNELWSNGGTAIGSAGVGFYTPPYFATTYPDQFDSVSHTGEHYMLMQNVTKTSAYIIVNTPHTFGAGSHITVDYGLTDSYGSTVVYSGTLNGVIKIPITGLTASTEYHYRLRWRNADVDASDLYGQDKTFSTLRQSGTGFRFGIQADSHSPFTQDTNIAFAKALFPRIRSYAPDFLIDLGDTQSADNGGAFFQDQFDKIYAEVNNGFQFLEVPIQFYVPGNHEGINAYYQNAGTNVAFPGHVAPWLNPAYGGASREKYFANIDHGVSPSPDHKTFCSWESGDAVFICIDPYTYTTEYPTDCDTNCTFTLGAVQQAWLANVLSTTTKKWKYIFSHQHLGGEPKNGNQTETTGGCYGKGGAEGFHRGQNLTELYPYITDPKHTVIFLGHDHFYAIDKYEDLHIVHVPSYGLWTAGQTWCQNPFGYTNSRKYQAGGVDFTGEKHGYFKAKVLTSPVDDGDYFTLSYQEDSGIEVLENIPIYQATSYYGPATLTNVTRNKQVHIYYASNAQIWSNAINTTEKTIKVNPDTYFPEDIEGWLQGDEIAILYNTPGFLVVDVDSEKTTITMIDVDGVPMPNSRLII